MSKDPERGELSMRLIVVMAVVAGLAWAIPLVFFGRQQTAYVGTLTGAPREEPAAEAPVGGSAPAAQQPAPVDTLGQANDVAAQATLTNAISVAQAYFAEHASFQGFGPDAASQYDPSVVYTSGPATPGVVSVRGVSASTVVLVTYAEGGGGPLCVAANGNEVSIGRSDAQTSLQCTGGWE